MFLREEPAALLDPLPIPPNDLRRAIGDANFDNPTGALIYDEVPAAAYERVFDFGCGCGRLARQLMQQRQARPRSYLGIDLNRAAVQWASTNLSTLDQSYRFEHFDVFNLQFNPATKQTQLPFPTLDTFTLAIAHSVFTHILESDVVFYMREIARILAKDSRFVSTWFLFDKKFFPMMQEFQNSLYIQIADPTNAVIYDREFVKTLFRACGLTIIRAVSPELRGFQWKLVAVPNTATVDQAEAEFPDDNAPFGLARPPTSTLDQT